MFKEYAMNNTYQLTFLPNWPISGGHFHKLSLDMAFVTFYQPMVEFSSHSNHFHISNQLTFLVRLANFRRWFSPIKSRFDLSYILPTYGRVFMSF